MLRTLTLFFERQKIPCGIVLSDQYYPDTGKPLTYPSPKPMLTQASLKSEMLAWGRGGRVVSQNPNWSSFSKPTESHLYFPNFFEHTSLSWKGFERIVTLPRSMDSWKRWGIFNDCKDKTRKRKVKSVGFVLSQSAIFFTTSRKWICSFCWFLALFAWEDSHYL